MNDEGARETAPLLFAQEGNPLTRIPFARTSLKASADAAAALFAGPESAHADSLRANIPEGVRCRGRGARSHIAH